ncbi:MAG TPA: PHB depolymerase family esterase [Gammaproteobacteria bacterium]|nr:PHB depolymerase family esterase [Gammaproteobacteria bacterium]
MKLANLLVKVRALLRWARLKLLPKPLFRGGIQAALVAWRDRRRESLPDDETHTFSARTYPGSRTRLYLVHVPRGTIVRRSRPLVVVLHGCQQDNRDIEQISGFNQLADRHGFLVAYPFITSYHGMRNRNCWGWWFDREIHAGSGEVEDLWQIVEEIKSRYAVDHRRIHVTGLSSGAGMAVAMMVAHADKIASGAAVAGVPYAEKAVAVRHAFNRLPRNRPVASIVSAMQAEMGEVDRPIPIQIVHSENDDKVDIQSARVLRDSWGHCFDIDTRHSYRVTNGQAGSASWEHSRYRNGTGKSAIETLFLKGPGHGWYGGNPGNHSFPDAPDVKRSIWKFFVSHPLHK